MIHKQMFKKKKNIKFSKQYIAQSIYLIIYMAKNVGMDLK